MKKLLENIVFTVSRVSYKYWVIGAFYFVYCGFEELGFLDFMLHSKRDGLFMVVSGLLIIISEIKWIRRANIDHTN